MGVLLWGSPLSFQTLRFLSILSHSFLSIKSGMGADRAGEPEAWEVWNAAADIPPRAPGWDLHRDAAERDTEQPSGGSGPAGTEDAGRPD